MAWPLITLVFAVSGGAFLFSTVRAIGRVQDEVAYYRLSISFWAGLALVGALMVGFLGRPLWGHELLSTDVGALTVGLMSILPAVVIFAGVRNALGLWAAGRRRRRALACGMRVPGTVVTRSRRFLGQDLMFVMVEADVPAPVPGPELTYRAPSPQRSQRHRFVEVCPSDQWARFAPGSGVEVCVDARETANFAVLLFGQPAPLPDQVAR